MEARIAEIEFLILLLAAFLRAALVEVVERLSFDRMITSCKSCSAISPVSIPLIKEWFSFDILQLLGRMDVNPVLAFVATVHLCAVDRCALGEQSLLSHDYEGGMLIILRGVEPFRCVLPDGTEERWTSCGEICPIYRKEYGSRGTTKPFVKATWLRHIDSREHCYGLPSLEAPDVLLNRRGSPTPSVNVEANTNFTLNFEKLRVDAVPKK